MGYNGTSKLGKTWSEYVYKTNTSFDQVIKILEDSDVISKRLLGILSSHVINLKSEISKDSLSKEDKLKIFSNYVDDFYNAITIYEPTFNKNFLIWLLKNFKNLKEELI